MKKLALDLTFGAVIPITILSFGTDYLGARPTFVLAGLIPAAYVFWDILFYSKRFNFITSVVAATAVAQGSAALLTVDGWKYALADTSGTIVTFLIFGVSLLLGRPIVNYFVVQVYQPETPEEEDLLWKMLRSKEVHRMMVLATLIILAENLLRGIGNYALNVWRVTAEFGTEEFNLQKRNVDSMTRFIMPVTAMGALFWAFYLVNARVDWWLEPVSGEGGTLYDQIRRRLALRGDGAGNATGPASRTDVLTAPPRRRTPAGASPAPAHHAPGPKDVPPTSALASAEPDADVSQPLPSQAAPSQASATPGRQAAADRPA
ncbi:MAG: VC0807 family protein [Tepidisphaerales bacterium]